MMFIEQMQHIAKSNVSKLLTPYFPLFKDLTLTNFKMNFVTVFKL